MQTHDMKLKPQSEIDLESLGLREIAYIRKVEEFDADGELSATGYVIHAADGTPVAVAQAFDAAYATILEHQMEPVSLH